MNALPPFARSTARAVERAPSNEFAAIEVSKPAFAG